MTLRFKTLDLVLLLAAYVLIGFTLGYFFRAGFPVYLGLGYSEKDLMLAVGGILFPFFSSLYLISRGVLGYRFKPATPLAKKASRKKALQKI